MEGHSKTEEQDTPFFCQSRQNAMIWELSWVENESNYFLRWQMSTEWMSCFSRFVSHFRFWLSSHDSVVACLTFYEGLNAANCHNDSLLS